MDPQSPAPAYASQYPSQQSPVPQAQYQSQQQLQGPVPYPAQTVQQHDTNGSMPMPQQQQQQMPQQMPQQQQQQVPQVVYANAPQGNVYLSATPIQSLQSYPAVIDCPRCGVRSMTVATPESGNTTHAWAALFCFCFCLGCIPYMMSSLKDVMHTCSSCGTPVALWHRSGRVELMGPANVQSPVQQQQQAPKY